MTTKIDKYSISRKRKLSDIDVDVKTDVRVPAKRRKLSKKSVKCAECGENVNSENKLVYCCECDERGCEKCVIDFSVCNECGDYYCDNCTTVDVCDHCAIPYCADCGDFKPGQRGTQCVSCQPYWKKCFSASDLCIECGSTKIRNFCIDCPNRYCEDCWGGYSCGKCGIGEFFQCGDCYRREPALCEQCELCECCCQC
eukprot:UN01423